MPRGGTLTICLFSDASQVPVRNLNKEERLPGETEMESDEGKEKDIVIHYMYSLQELW